LRLAHERELGTAMEQLEGDFKRWRAGDIDVFELDQRIHRHHQGPSREFWKRYASSSDWELLLPAALHRGVLSVEDFPDDLWDAVGSRIEEIRKGLFEQL